MQPHRLESVGVWVANGDVALNEKVSNIAVTEVESIVEPDCTADDIWREAVALVCIHSPILSISAS